MKRTAFLVLVAAIGAAGLMLTSPTPGPDAPDTTVAPCSAFPNPPAHTDPYRCVTPDGSLAPAPTAP